MVCKVEEDRPLQANVRTEEPGVEQLGAVPFDLNGNIEDVQASGPQCSCAVWFALMSAGSEASLTIWALRHSPWGVAYRQA